MHKLLLIISLSALTFNGLAQNNPRPSRSRFWNAKESTFNIKAGDILIYHIKNNSEEYEYIVTITKVDNGIDFDFKAPSKKLKGHTIISAGSLNDGPVNQTDLTGGSKTALWLSKSSFRDLATDQQTLMDMGNGIDTFRNTNTSTIKINYKGKEKIITVYKIENESDTGKRKFSVLNELSNPLIVTMDAGWTLTLKEVR